MAEAIEASEKVLSGGGKLTVFTPNAEIAHKMRQKRRNNADCFLCRYASSGRRRRAESRWNSRHSAEGESRQASNTVKTSSAYVPKKDILYIFSAENRA